MSDPRELTEVDAAKLGATEDIIGFVEREAAVESDVLRKWSLMKVAGRMRELVFALAAATTAREAAEGERDAARALFGSASNAAVGAERLLEDLLTFIGVGLVHQEGRDELQNAKQSITGLRERIKFTESFESEVFKRREAEQRAASLAEGVAGLRAWAEKEYADHYDWAGQQRLLGFNPEAPACGRHDGRAKAMADVLAELDRISPVAPVTTEE